LNSKKNNQPIKEYSNRSLNRVSSQSSSAISFARPDTNINFAIQKKENQQKSHTAPDNGINFTIQKKENKTGLPDQLKSGIENLSGHAMDDVRVHYNSPQPAQLNAHAYAQGNQIHVAPGQEKHLAHEAWHVVQQKQGRVKPTKQLKSSVAINDEAGLEKEADVMGAKAEASIQLHRNTAAISPPFKSAAYQPVQRRIVKQDEGERLKLSKIVSDSQLEDELEGYDDDFKAVVWHYQRQPHYYSFQQVMTLALRTRIDHLPPDDDDHDVDSSSSELEDDVPELEEIPGKSTLTKKLPAITRINSSYISPRSPGYAPLSAPVKSQGETWEDNRDAFVKAFNKRIQGGMKSGHPSSLQGSDNNLSRLAWIIETLNQARTCVAVILSDTHLHVFANHHDAKLQTQLQDLITASQDLSFASKEYHAILHLLTEHVLVNRGSRPKKKETIDRKTGMVQRRLQKAMQLINQLNLGLKSVKVHEVNQSHKGRKKHGEMRAGDAVASSRQKGDKTPLHLDVGISKICCGKCELALQALSGIYGITFKVQEAHWQIYDTDTGWPVPEFLKTNPEAMKMFLGDEAYNIYVKFPAEAIRVIEGMKKVVKSKERLDNPSSKDTGYISSEDEYDEDKYTGDKGGPSGVEDDKDSDSHSSSSESDDDYDELDSHEVIDGYDEDGTPDITISDHMIQLYLQDLELSGAYLSVAEGQVIAAALNVRARVFNRLTVSTNGYYYDPDNNRYYQETPLQTLADGDCLLHGLNLIRQNQNMSQAQIRICRLYIGNMLNHDLLRIQIEDLVRAKIQGDYIPGLGPNMSRILNFNYEIQKAMHQEASKSSFKPVSVSHSGHVSKEDSHVGKEDHEHLPEDDDELVSPDHQATGTIAFNTTYGNAGPGGYLLFTGDHYIRIAPCRNPFG